MVPDRQKVRTDGRDGQTHGRRQNYIPPTSSGDNNRFKKTDSLGISRKCCLFSINSIIIKAIFLSCPI